MQKIKIVSDGNELEFKEEITKDSKGKKLSETRLCFVYTKSSTKLGSEIIFCKKDFEKLIKDGNFVKL